MKIEIELPDEAVDEIVRKELRWALKTNSGLVHSNPEDVANQDELVQALEIVCEYFGVSDEL